MHSHSTNFESQISHSTNVNFDHLRHITTRKLLVLTIVCYENNKTFTRVHYFLIVVLLQLCTETCNAQTWFNEVKHVTQCTVEFISCPDILTFDLTLGSLDGNMLAYNSPALSMSKLLIVCSTYLQHFLEKIYPP